VDDRIRAISQGLGLRTVLWEYDSQDWQVGTTAGFGPELVDKEYQAMIDDANKGMFNTVSILSIPSTRFILSSPFKVRYDDSNARAQRLYNEYGNKVLSKT